MKTDDYYNPKRYYLDKNSAIKISKLSCVQVLTKPVLITRYFGNGLGLNGFHYTLPVVQKVRHISFDVVIIIIVVLDVV